MIFGQAAGGIKYVIPAGDLVREMSAEARAVILQNASMLSQLGGRGARAML